MRQESRQVLYTPMKELKSGVGTRPLPQQTFRGLRRGSQQSLRWPGEDLRNMLAALPVPGTSGLLGSGVQGRYASPSLEGGCPEPSGPPTLAPLAALGRSPTLQHGCRTPGDPPQVNAAAPGEHSRT